MFPTGVAGAALLLLRILVATNLVWEGTAHWTLVTSVWIVIVFVSPAICLCIGFLAPYFALLGVAIQLVVLYEVGGRHGFHLALSFLFSLVLAALGPGGYSIDAHLFGRKLLIVQPHKCP